MREVRRYEIGWGEEGVLGVVLGEVWERYGGVELVVEFHDVGGRFWIGCYFVSTVLIFVGVSGGMMG